jgi:hyperosmotically inducible periplasmic protein
MNRSFGSVVSGLVLTGAFLCPSSMLAAQEKSPDNSAVNKQDRSTSQPTADQAKNNMSDRDMMKNIRRDIVKDKSLSTYGHNVKVVADHGKVTLKGPVRSEDEKRAVAEYARKYAGDGNVTDELTVAPDQK